MAAIITITFNPCIDVNVTVPALTPEIKLRCSDVLLQPGGGGINVARAIRRLGGDVTAIYLAAGDSGKELTGMLEKEGVSSVVLPILGKVRESLNVVDKSSGLQYRFILPGPAISDEVLEGLPGIIDLQDNLEFIIVSGSLPPGLSTRIFDELAAIAGRKGIRLIVDTSGPALQAAVAAGVYMIKASTGELSSLAGGQGGKDIIDITSLAQRVIAHSKCQVVVVSLGGEGALLVTDGSVKKISPPAVKTVSTTGAGDSMVAGIVWSLSKGKSLEKAVAYGCACGTASTMNPGTTLFRPEDVDRIVARVHIDGGRTEYVTDDQNYKIL
ncbi:MAG TPA: 1-phosphofructokinase family hexose kinase [Puia sp.]|nr:1-phosphofructokinase family hexose kinase [Puia sp.]